MRASKEILLQRNICCCTHKYDVITFVCTTFYLFPSPLVSCVKLSNSSHLTVYYRLHTLKIDLFV